jgi:hypothetical protein
VIVAGPVGLPESEAVTTFPFLNAVGATDEVKEGPNYVQVTDNRGTEAGWSLKVKQED